MTDFTVRSDSVDVEQIMRQIRARVREKRGVDYTEAEISELAKVKLETFLDPRGVRSNLVEQYRKHRTPSPAPPNYEFEDSTIYDTHRGFIRAIRRLLNPLLKLFFNPNTISNALHIQAKVNTENHDRFRKGEEMAALTYEVVHNLVVEVTRLGIDVHNLKMRVESLTSRMDFDERRARSLEGVVQYRSAGRGSGEGSSRPETSRPDSRRPDSVRTEAPSPSDPPRPDAQRPDAPPRPDAARPGAGRPDPASQDRGRPPGDRPESARAEGADAAVERRRRRRRRRRRPGQTLGDAGPGAPTTQPAGAGPEDTGDFSDDGGPDDGGSDDGAGDQ